MASSYALPTPPLPHNHGHGHVHAQSLGHSQSPPSFGHSRRADRGGSGGGNAVHAYSQSLESLQSQGYGQGGAHSRSQTHDSDLGQAAHTQNLSQNLSQYKANSYLPMQRRDKRPTPISSRKASPSNLSPVIDMSPASPGQYRSDYLDAPVQSNDHGHSAHHQDHDEHAHAHDHSHDHGHDHGHDHHGHHDHDHDHSHNHSHSHDHHGHHDHSHDHGHHDHHHDHAHDHFGHDHKHGHSHAQTYSKLTGLLLPYSSRWPLLHSVMTEKDSRRIFYFMIVNFSFMGVQAFYGYITDSLGLLSDSIHMFFDCVALAVGLFAAVMSKWSPNQRFPYGFGKIETLSGFANGVFLILISVEIMFEGVERLLEGRETKRLLDLFVVSTLGLLVNLLGIFAFGSHSHAHHGHDHGHDHGHSHGHDHGHSHGHDNENMHGIYLHIMADMLGSASVIASTVLTYFIPWSGWDPLASFLIAYLIAITAIPLVKSSAQRLLLTNPDDAEYMLRNTLSGVTDVRGVTAYAVPKFWADDRTGDAATGGGCPSEAKTKLIGVIHVAAARGADLDDVRDRVRAYLADQHIDMTIQVEREGDTACWCGMGRALLGGPRSPGLPPGASISSLY